MTDAGRERLGPLVDAVDAAVDDLVARRVASRMLERDHTLWQDDPREVADRLGWLDSPAALAAGAPELEQFVKECVADGLSHVVLMGMGGSSLFPEVLARVLGPSGGALQLRVLDTTDPAAIRRAAGMAPPEETLFVAASKSGTTIETTSHLAFFWERVGRPEHFAVITDPGSPLGEEGRERGFRRVFENRPDIGGRYSALSLFGAVPGALLGVDVAAIAAGGAGMIERCTTGTAVDDRTNPALRLGALMAVAVRAGRDKLTLVLPDEIASFGAWLEQLIAESTGKAGTGVVPVDAEPLGPPEVYGDDRVFVAYAEDPRLDLLVAGGHPVVVLPFAEGGDLGAEVARWELATAVCGVLLGINPFDQPDVAAAKAATARALERGLPDVRVEPLARLLNSVRPGDYLAIQAYVDPEGDAVPALQAARVVLRDRLRVATTLGLGPRFLHSTGQLHKGGPPTGVFLQVVGEDEAELPIPGHRHGFSLLKRAQAAGDLRTLSDRRLRAARVSLDELVEVSR